MSRLTRAALAATLIALVSACAQYENKRGVLDNWQGSMEKQFVRGETSRQQVLDLLGPPSQVVALGDETVMYYLFEQSDGSGLILIVYNQFRIDTRYDRAIFFFDESDTLRDYATHFASDTTR